MGIDKFNIDKNNDGKVDEQELRELQDFYRGLKNTEKAKLFHNLESSQELKDNLEDAFLDRCKQMKLGFSRGETLSDDDVNVLKCYAGLYYGKDTKVLDIKTASMSPEIQEIFDQILKNIDITDETNGNIDDLSKLKIIKITNETLNQTINIEISKLGIELKEKYDQIREKGGKYKMLWTMLSKECQSQQGEHKGMSGYWKYWSKFVNKDAILDGYGTSVFDDNIRQFDTYNKIVFKNILKGDKKGVLQNIQNMENLFDRLESQLRGVVDNDETDGNTYLGAFSINLSNINEYQQKLENSDLGVLEFMANVMKKPEYINYYMTSNIKIDGKTVKDLENTMLSEQSDEKINQFFTENRIIICGKKMILRSKIDFAETIKDTREEFGDTPISKEQKILVLKQKILKEVLDNVDEDNLKGERIFELYLENDGFMKDLERNWTGYAIKGGMIAAACYGTLGVGDKILGGVGSKALIEASGAGLFLGKFGLDLTIFHSTMTGVGTMMQGGSMGDFMEYIQDLEGWGNTALFMGVFVGVGAVLQKLGNLKYLEDIKEYKTGKILINSVNFGLEVGAVIGVSNLMFDGEFTAEQLINVTILVGMLRVRKKMNEVYTVKNTNGEIKISMEEIKETKDQKKETIIDPEAQKIKELKDKIDKAIHSKNFEDYFNDIQMKYLLDNYLGKDIDIIKGQLKPENYLDRGYNGAIFTTDNGKYIIKVPLHEEAKMEMVGEAQKQDNIYNRFEEIKFIFNNLKDTTINGVEGNIQEVKQYIQSIYIPKIFRINTERGLIVMENIQRADPVLYFRYKHLLETNFSDVIQKLGIDLNSLSLKHIEKLSKILHSEYNVKKPLITDVKTPILERGQIDTLIEVFRLFESIGYSHKDIHGKNLMISKDNISPSQPYRKIYIIDFGTSQINPEAQINTINLGKKIPYDKNETDIDMWLAIEGYVGSEGIDVPKTIETIHNLYK